MRGQYRPELAAHYTGVGVGLIAAGF